MTSVTPEKIAQEVSDHHSAMRSLFNATSVFNVRPMPDPTTAPVLPTSKSTYGIMAASKQSINQLLNGLSPLL